MDRIILAALVLATCLLAGMISCVKHITGCNSWQLQRYSAFADHLIVGASNQTQLAFVF